MQIIIIIETVHGRNIQQHPSHPHGGYKIEDSDINDGINATTIRKYCNIPIFDLNRHSIEQIQSSCFNAHRPCIINNVKHQYKNPITNEMINLYDEFNKTNFINKYGKLILRQNSPSEVPFSLPTGEATSVKKFFQHGIHQQSNHFFKSNWKTVSWHDSNKEDIPIICAQRGGSTLYLPQFWAVCDF